MPFQVHEFRVPNDQFYSFGITCNESTMRHYKETVFAIFIILFGGSIGYPSNGKDSVKWYTHCEGFQNEGIIINVTLSNCDQLQGCVLQKEQTQNVQVYFQAGKQHSELLYNVYIYSGSDYHYLQGGTNLRNVLAGQTYVFEVDFQIPVKVADGQNVIEIYQFQADRPNSYEFCTRFAIQGLTDPSETPSQPPVESTSTSTTSTSTTTTESTTSSAPPPGPFQCRSQGTFPDPYSCSAYHICTLLQDGSYWQQTLGCSFGTVFCPLMSNCFHPDSCPCNL